MPFFSGPHPFPHVRVFRATAAGEEDIAIDSETILVLLRPYGRDLEKQPFCVRVRFASSADRGSAMRGARLFWWVP